MKKIISISIASYFIVFFSNLVYGQTNTDSLINGGMTLELKNDTLFSNTGLKFFVGQKLIIGNASGETGYYRSIISKNATIVPSIGGRDMRFENAIENHVNKNKSREKVKSSLFPGNYLTIKKISLWKNSKPNFYLVSLFSDLNYYSGDIRLALVLKELLLQP
jgi:hypothetical protein